MIKELILVLYVLRDTASPQWNTEMFPNSLSHRWEKKFEINFLPKLIPRKVHTKINFRLKLFVAESSSNK